MTYSPFMLFLMSSHRAKAIVNLPLSSRNTRFRPYFPFFIAHARRRTEETIIYLLIRVTQIYPVKYLPGRVRIPPKCFLNDPPKIGHFHFPMFALLYTPSLAESFIFRRRIRDNSGPSFSSGSKTRIRKFWRKRFFERLLVDRVENFAARYQTRRLIIHLDNVGRWSSQNFVLAVGKST